MYAHYFKFGKKHSITLSTGPRPVGQSRDFASKKEATLWAKQNKATPYNY